MKRLTLLVSMLILNSVVRAEVLRSSEVGFTVKHQAEVSMPPPAAWAALADIGRWWDPEHTYSGDARNLTLDPRVGGCFCEKLGMYAGAQHMSVIFAQPPKLLRLAGALGPLQEFALAGSMTWQIEAGGGGSRITVTYTAGGYADRPLAEWAPIVDSVVATQVQRLAKLINTGSADETKPAGK
ncbi:MAG: SRPBCC family protein [Candidatus Obscuribacterales bacterium]|nr:SRPBCC family protein [Steroidobacteraceae bacterium]